MLYAHSRLHKAYKTIPCQQGILIKTCLETGNRIQKNFFQERWVQFRDPAVFFSPGFCFLQALNFQTAKQIRFEAPGLPGARSWGHRAWHLPEIDCFSASLVARFCCKLHTVFFTDTWKGHEIYVQSNHSFLSHPVGVFIAFLMKRISRMQRSQEDMQLQTSIEPSERLSSETSINKQPRHVDTSKWRHDGMEGKFKWFYWDF